MPDAADPRSPPPKFIRPQLSLLAETPPAGSDWAVRPVEARSRQQERLATIETGVDAIAIILDLVPIRGDGRGDFRACRPNCLCRRRAVCGSFRWNHFLFRDAGRDRRGTHRQPCVLVFDLLFLDGEKLAGLPLLERKERLKALVEGAPRSVQYSDHHIGDGQRFLQVACGRSPLANVPDGRSP